MYTHTHAYGHTHTNDPKPLTAEAQWTLTLYFLTIAISKPAYCFNPGASVFLCTMGTMITSLSARVVTRLPRKETVRLLDQIKSRGDTLVGLESKAGRSPR